MDIMVNNILSVERVILNLAASNKEEVIKELLSVCRLDRPDMVKDEILRREALMSTGLGAGIAIPRGFTQVVEQPQAVLGVSKKGIDFNSLDHLPVNVFLLMLFPSNYKNYPGYVAAALNLLSQETVRSKIPEFDSVDELIKFIIHKEI